MVINALNVLVILVSPCFQHFSGYNSSSTVTIELLLSMLVEMNNIVRCWYKSEIYRNYSIEKIENNFIYIMSRLIIFWNKNTSWQSMNDGVSLYKWYTSIEQIPFKVKTANIMLKFPQMNHHWIQRFFIFVTEDSASTLFVSNSIYFTFLHSLSAHLILKSLILELNLRSVAQSLTNNVFMPHRSGRI